MWSQGAGVPTFSLGKIPVRMGVQYGAIFSELIDGGSSLESRQIERTAAGICC